MRAAGTFPLHTGLFQEMLPHALIRLRIRAYTEGMTTNTTTTRSGRETAITTVTIIEPRDIRGLEVDRIYKEVRTYDGEYSGTYYHAGNGTQFVPIDSNTYNTLVSG